MLVVLPHRTDEHADPAGASQRCAGVAGVLQAGPHGVQQQPQLRVEAGRLRRGDVEQQAVKRVDVVEVPAGRQVPARCGDLVPAPLRYRTERAGTPAQVTPEGFRVVGAGELAGEADDRDLGIGVSDRSGSTRTGRERWALPRRRDGRRLVVAAAEERVQVPVPAVEPELRGDPVDGDGADGAQPDPAGGLPEQEQLAEVPRLQQQEPFAVSGVHGFDRVVAAEQVHLKGRLVEDRPVVDEVHRAVHARRRECRQRQARRA